MNRSTDAEAVDVYQFTDESPVLRRPTRAATAADDHHSNHFQQQELHRQYVQHSLAKQFRRPPVTRNEFRIRFAVKKWHNRRQEVTLNYRQFVDHYRNHIKTYYPFLPANQINEMARRMCLKVRQKCTTNGGSVTPKKKRRNSDKMARKSIMTSNRRSVPKRAKKRVSFAVAANRSADDLAADSRVEQSSINWRPKSQISRFVKPLDISFGSPVKASNDRPLASTSGDGQQPEQVLSPPPTRKTRPLASSSPIERPRFHNSSPVSPMIYSRRRTAHLSPVSPKASNRDMDSPNNSDIETDLPNATNGQTVAPKDLTEEFDSADEEEEEESVADRNADSPKDTNEDSDSPPFNASPKMVWPEERDGHSDSPNGTNRSPVLANTVRQKEVPPNGHSKREPISTKLPVKSSTPQTLVPCVFRSATPVLRNRSIDTPPDVSPHRSPAADRRRESLPNSAASGATSVTNGSSRVSLVSLLKNKWKRMKASIPSMGLPIKATFNKSADDLCDLFDIDASQTERESQ